MTGESDRNPNVRTDVIIADGQMLQNLPKLLPIRNSPYRIYKAKSNPIRMTKKISDVNLERVKAWQRHLSTGVLDALVFVNPSGPNFDRVCQAVEIVNTAQSYYRLKLKLDEGEEYLPHMDSPPNPNLIRQKLRAKHPNNLTIAVIERDMEDSSNLVTINEEPGCTIISCANWGGIEDAPATRIYLVYQFISALITFASCLTVSENSALTHRLPKEYDTGNTKGRDDPKVLRGCLFDYWVGSKLIYLCMVCARLCPSCRSSLLAHGTPLEAIVATEKLLDWVRSVIIGREQYLPRKVFIGHGRKNDWMVLRDMLRKWNLIVEEFNEEPVAGISISQRLKFMLEDSRFAFLVMTAEDKNADGYLSARMNVIHEIGLFQGRLGDKYAVVLRERNTKVFTNLDGINRLDYDPGKLSSLKPDIRRLLIARGVIPADVAR